MLSASFSSERTSFTATEQRRSAVSSSLAESWTAEYASAMRSKAPRTCREPQDSHQDEHNSRAASSECDA